MRLIFKIFKWLGLIVLLLIFILAAAPWLPVALDQIGKSKYQSWLTENAASLDIDQAEPGFNFDDEFYQNRLIILGEVHGYETVQRLDYALLQHLRQRTDRPIWYLAEIPPHIAHGFNEYVLGGSDAGVRAAFDYWSDPSRKLQWGNQNFFDKLTKIRALNATLTDRMKIRFIGVDKPPANLSKSYDAFTDAGDVPISFNDPDADQRINNYLGSLAAQRPADARRYAHIVPNIEALTAMSGADDILFYGLWGLFHSVRTSVNDIDPLAARLNGPDGSFEDNVGVVSTICVSQCKNMMPAGALPGLPTPPNGENYIQIPLSYDTPYFLRVRGVGELKAVAGDNAVTIFRLDGENSPYKEGSRAIEASGYLALLQPFEIEGPPTEALDYLVVVQGSKALSPWNGTAWNMK